MTQEKLTAEELTAIHNKFLSAYEKDKENALEMLSDWTMEVYPMCKALRDLDNGFDDFRPVYIADKLCKLGEAMNEISKPRPEYVEELRNIFEDARDLLMCRNNIQTDSCGTCVYDNWISDDAGDVHWYRVDLDTGEMYDDPSPSKEYTPNRYRDYWPD